MPLIIVYNDGTMFSCVAMNILAITLQNITAIYRAAATLHAAGYDDDMA